MSDLPLSRPMPGFDVIELAEGWGITKNPFSEGLCLLADMPPLMEQLVISWSGYGEENFHPERVDVETALAKRGACWRTAIGDFKSLLISMQAFEASDEYDARGSIATLFCHELLTDVSLHSFSEMRYRRALRGVEA